jgi:hypothetical protein
MSNDFNHKARSMNWIHLALDFTEDTDFVEVHIPPATANIAGKAVVVTSEGRSHSLE